VTEKTVEWNLGFARDEVLAGLEKLLAGAGYLYTRTESEAEVRFQVTLPQGSLGLTVRPLLSQRSPFGPHLFFHRTLLIMTYRDVSVQDEETFLRRLTLTFLRAGG
jgi:hypothetical protein